MRCGLQRCQKYKSYRRQKKARTVAGSIIRVQSRCLRDHIPLTRRQIEDCAPALLPIIYTVGVSSMRDRSNGIDDRGAADRFASVSRLLDRLHKPGHDVAGAFLWQA